MIRHFMSYCLVEGARGTWARVREGARARKGEKANTEPLPGVLGNKGTGTFIFWEQGIFSNYFQRTRELLSTLL